MSQSHCFVTCFLEAYYLELNKCSAKLYVICYVNSSALLQIMLFTSLNQPNMYCLYAIREN